MLFPLRSGLLTAGLLWLLTPPALLSQVERREPLAIAPGTPVESGLAGGESHSYLVAVQAGHPLLITVDQRGTDVEIEAAGPDGRSLGVVDTPTGREGPESLLLDGGAAGAWRVVVRSPGKAAPPGRYEIRVEELPQGTAAERERVAAERLATEGARLRKKGTAEAAREAVARYTEAAGHWRALGRRREEATALYVLASLHGALSDARQALGAYRQAMALWEALGEPDRQADVLSAMGLAHWALGEDKEALAVFERAIALRQSRGDRAGEASALNNLCLLHHSQGRLDDALACYQRALALFREAGEAGGEARSLINLGGVYDLLGEPRQALENYGQALDRMVAAGNRLGEAQVLNNLGVTAIGLGEMGDALARYNRALAIFRELGDRQWEARTLNNLGSAYYDLGEMQRARAAFEQALELRRAVGDRRGESVTLNQLGRVHQRLAEGTDRSDRPDPPVEAARAQDLFRQARDLARSLGDRRGEADSLVLLGKELILAGDLDKSMAVLRQAADILAGLGERRSRALALQRLGEALLARGDLPKAREAFGQALALRLTTADRAGEAETLTALAQLDARLGRIPDARAQAGKALALIESLRITVANPDLRASFLSAYRQAFELEIDLLMRLDRLEPGRGHAREALEVSERARSRALLDLLREARTDVRTGGDPALREREKALTERLNAKAERQIERLSGAAATRAADESELQALLTELDGVRAEIRRRSPRYAALTQPAPLRAADVQALLDPKTLLLEYSLGEERSYLWAVEAGSIAAFELPARAGIEAAARRVYAWMHTLDPGAAKQGQAEAAALSRLLLGPVANRLNGRRLVIVADGALHYLPFAALPMPAALPGTGDLLIDRQEIVTLPSASVLAAQRRDLGGRPRAAKTVAVLADPVFDAADTRISKSRTASAAPGPVKRGGDPAGFPALQRLPSTRLEAERISALVPAGEALVELDFAADREAVLDGRLAPYRLVHFATHGLIDARTPELSGLMLSRVGEDGKPKEGFLSLADIYNLQLGADLVVLSGCETALGQEVRGEGLMGLTRGFLYAGAARVVASLWRVQDRATAELMSRFYRALLLEGKPPATALREAQLAIRSDRRWRAPYYWAAFILQGDWTDGAGSGEIRRTLEAVPN